MEVTACNKWALLLVSNQFAYGLYTLLRSVLPNWEVLLACRMLRGRYTLYPPFAIPLCRSRGSVVPAGPLPIVVRLPGALIRPLVAQGLLVCFDRLFPYLLVPKGH